MGKSRCDLTNPSRSFGLKERPFGLHPVRDIDKHRLRADRPAIRISHGAVENLQMEISSLGRPVLLDIMKQFSSLDDPLIVVAMSFRQRSRVDVEVGLSEKLVQ
jgi:hypothetical protein